MKIKSTLFIRRPKTFCKMNNFNKNDSPADHEPANVVSDLNWNDMNLKKDLVRRIYDCGLGAPSTIQVQAIRKCVEQHDIVAQAQPGTGKVAIFSIAILQRIDVNVPECQAVILAPTTQSAIVIQKVVMSLGRYMQAQCHVFGKSVREDRRQLEGGCHVFVGTPPHVEFMIENKLLRTSTVKMLVFDEADEMWSRDYRSQIQGVFNSMPYNVQCILLSDTMPAALTRDCKCFMNNPVRIVEELSGNDRYSR